MYSRFREHLNVGNSPVYKHLSECHNIPTPRNSSLIPLSWKIVERNLRHPNVRRSVEALNIRRAHSLMNGCCGRELDV